MSGCPSGCEFVYVTAGPIRLLQKLDDPVKKEDDLPGDEGLEMGGDLRLPALWR